MSRKIFCIFIFYTPIIFRNQDTAWKIDQDSPVTLSTKPKCGPLGARGEGVLVVKPVVEHRGWKRMRSKEYLGYGRGYLLVRGWWVVESGYWCDFRMVQVSVIETYSLHSQAHSEEWVCEKIQELIQNNLYSDRPRKRTPWPQMTWVDLDSSLMLISLFVRVLI